MISRKSLSACASRVRVSLKKVLVLFDNSLLFHFFLLPFRRRTRRGAATDIWLVFFFFLLPLEVSFQKCSWICRALFGGAYSKSTMVQVFPPFAHCVFEPGIELSDYFIRDGPIYRSRWADYSSPCHNAHNIRTQRCS